MSSSTIATCDHGIVARTKRVIMDRDTYDKKWKLGPYAKKKEELKQQGKLDKYGRVVDRTPEAWKLLFGDPDQAVNINEVVEKVTGGKKVEENVEEEGEKREKKKKEKKDKKEKKEKKEKKKKETSDSD
jgi:H/ACA ribonucleoprotein complex subunit 4